jgi:hypothetical protein
MALVLGAQMAGAATESSRSEDPGEKSPSTEVPGATDAPARPSIIEALLEDFIVADCGTGDENDGCFLLETTHDGEGIDPLPFPECEIAICLEGRYRTETPIQLSAQPADGFEVGSWTETDDDISTYRTNSTTMVDNGRSVQVNYVPGVDRSEFASGFEVDGFGDWWGESCKPCDGSEGTVAAGRSVYPADAETVAKEPAVQQALLIGHGAANLDLHLWQLAGGEWREVAAGTSAAPQEWVRFPGAPGRYRWEVRSTGGAATFNLWTNSLAAASAAPNRIEQSNDFSTQKQNSLKLVFTKGSRGVYHAVDQTPGFGGGETDYKVGFQIRVAEGTVVKGKKHQILRLVQSAGNQRVIEVFLRKAKGQPGRYAVRVRGRQGGSKGPISNPVNFDPDTWVEIGIEWRAASAPGANDGVVRLFEEPRNNPNPVWEAALDNANDVVDMVYLGIVTKGSGGTEGAVYIDEFESSWDN